MAKAQSNESKNNPVASKPSVPPPKQASDLFGSFATEAARLCGKPIAFITIAGLVFMWLVAGPVLHFSETWLLVMNTVGTIITLLLVFLIQNTQNRDTLALQLKLAELILVIEGAEPKMAMVEDLSHDDLEQLKDKLRKRTEESE
jgi:low affinity Fe/Cu permease